MKTTYKTLLALLATTLMTAACDRLPNNGVNTGAPPFGSTPIFQPSSGPIITNPTSNPTSTPTGNPTATPTDNPSTNPTSTPTDTPSTTPTSLPTSMPTGAPMMPSAAPTANTTPGSGNFMQLERLARPAINEGLIITNDLLNTWNMVPPSVDLTPAAKPIADEATAVLKALGNTDAQVGALFTALLPDVMRIDTTRKSGYVGSGPGMLDNVTKDLRPIGGRMIMDDVIDVTLQLVVPGGGPTGTPIANLESDNVSYSGPNSNGTGHKAVMNDFPYLPAPN